MRTGQAKIEDWSPIEVENAASEASKESGRREKAVPALVLGSGITALGVIRSLGRVGIPLYAACPTGELPTWSRWYRPAPLLAQRTPTPNELVDYLTSREIRSLSAAGLVLIPCSDDWATAAASIPEDLKSRFLSSISPPEVMEAMINKWSFAQAAERVDIPRPQTMLLRSLTDMAGLADACYENTLLKPIESQSFCAMNQCKAYRIRRKSEALEIMARLANKGAGAFPILLQEYIPGPAASYFLVDGFVDRNRNIRALIARRRIRMYPPDFGNSTLSETIPLEQVGGAVESLTRMWSGLPYRGIFDAEFKYDDREGTFKVIEVNPRPWWHVGFVARCGVDLCRMAYLDALGLPVEAAFHYPAGRRTAYLANDFRAYRAADCTFTGIFRWISSWAGAYDAIYSSEDLRPGIAFTLELLKHTFRR